MRFTRPHATPGVPPRRSAFTLWPRIVTPPVTALSTPAGERRALITATSNTTFTASFTAFMAVTALLAMLFSPPARADCWDIAAERYRLDPLLLYAIAQVESNLDMKARNANRNGTYDIGLMQINSSHLSTLSHYGVNERRLREDACTSIVTGAWILAGFVRRYGYGWEAVGAYNAGVGEARAPLRREYADKVRKRYAALVAERDRRLMPFD
ncbi:transglycosylase SLT domain-containing protein [Pandoraea anhela]|uniref:Invasion protein IagB n=1 Tax=Pandoraea anhela TaxID=2508295 RepID=A0A5E4SI00_9BURK|nr:transglycosylase SLT domain-containing protein [Pandoraea anhela]VVD74811.1 invasion protein IagB [Pandoraea anhela]